MIKIATENSLIYLFLFGILIIYSCERNKILTDVHTDVYENGKVKCKGAFINGKKEGYWITFFPNGNIESEMVYFEGKLNGQFNLYYDSGKIRFKGYMVSNIPKGQWFFYYPNGNIEMKGERDKDPIGIWEYYTDDNKLDRKIRYNKDKIDTLIDNHLSPSAPPLN